MKQKRKLRKVRLPEAGHNSRIGACPFSSPKYPPVRAGAADHGSGAGQQDVVSAELYQ